MRKLMTRAEERLEVNPNIAWAWYEYFKEGHSFKEGQILAMKYDVSEVMLEGFKNVKRQVGQ